MCVVDMNAFRTNFFSLSLSRFFFFLQSYGLTMLCNLMCVIIYYFDEKKEKINNLLDMDLLYYYYAKIKNLAKKNRILNCVELIFLGWQKKNKNAGVLDIAKNTELLRLIKRVENQIFR